MVEADAVCPALTLEDIGFAFNKSPVLAGINLPLTQGTFFSLLGPSGGGKTTLLKLIGGYIRPTKGKIILQGRDVTRLPPEQRDIGMVFQNYALFPHLTARGNVSFGLEMRRVPRPERQRRVESMLDRVGLTTAERDRHPARLSGGQQQRVALARALVLEPKLLLLDEPLANLDRQLREQLRGELKDLQRRSGVTALLVTHDRDEALTLADEVGVLSAGRLLQAGTPEDVYQRPRYPFVASLVGDANLFMIERIESEEVRLVGGLRIPKARKEVDNWRVGGRLLLRPEHCRLIAGNDRRDAGPTGPTVVWPGQVTTIHYLGCDEIVDVAVTGERTVRVRQRAAASLPIARGSSVSVVIPWEDFWLIPDADPDWLLAAGKDACDARP